jgi:iron complex outermembrane receptor protein
VGLKYSGRDLGFPARFNLALYNQWIDDIQRGANLISPITKTAILATVSVPKAQVTGFEADASIRPARWLHLGGSLAYTDARFTQNRVTIPGNPPLFYGPYADTPRWTGTAFAEFIADIEDRGEIRLRGDFYAQSRSYFNNLAGTLVPGATIDPYRLVHGRLSWEKALGQPLSIALYGRNLFNQKYYTGGDGVGYSSGFNIAFPGMPRTYGLEVRLDF